MSVACQMEPFGQVVQLFLSYFFNMMQFFLKLVNGLGSASSTFSESQ